MISEIFILTGSSEVLVRKIYRSESKTVRAVKLFTGRLQDVSGGRTPPHFVEDGIHLYYISRCNLYFVAVSMADLMPIVITELLTRVYHMLKDHLGAVSEDSVRANTLLVFEILSESVDGGYIQIASTEQIRPLIRSQAVATAKTPSTPEEVASRIFGIDNQMASSLQSTAAASAITHKHLYVDVKEDLTCVVSATGEASHVKVEGAVHISGYVMGHTLLKIALTEDLQIVKPGEEGAFGGPVKLSSYSLHPNVDPAQFEAKRMLCIAPTAGEFSAMTYTVVPTSVSLPINVQSRITNIPGSRDVSLKVKVSLNTRPYVKAVRIHIVLPVPQSVASMSQNVSGPSESLVLNKGQIDWTVCSLTTVEPSVAQLRLISRDGQAISTKDIGPATAEFELSNHTLSGLTVRSIKVMEGPHHQKNIERFLRCRSTSTSFTVLLS